MANNYVGWRRRILPVVPGRLHPDTPPVEHAYQEWTKDPESATGEWEITRRFASMPRQIKNVGVNIRIGGGAA
jgi:hypothetical protein